MLLLKDVLDCISAPNSITERLRGWERVDGGRTAGRYRLQVGRYVLSTWALNVLQQFCPRLALVAKAKAESIHWQPAGLMGHLQY